MRPFSLPSVRATRARFYQPNVRARLAETRRPFHSSTADNVFFGACLVILLGALFGTWAVMGVFS
jgi:hypothetical protein